MKVNQVPQNNKNIYGDRCKTIQYAINEKGKYVPVKSVGLEPVNIALEQAWKEVETNIAEAKQEVEDGKKSPIYYFMKKEIMDIQILSETIGMPKWKVKRHLKPKVFSKLKPEILEKYAKIFKLRNIKELNNF